MVRLLTPEELPSVIDDAESFYNEFYADRGQFNREHFHQQWLYFLQFGQGVIFIESDENGDRGTFGAFRGQSIFTGETEYIGIFTAIRKEHRGKLVVLSLMEGAFAMIQSWGVPCNVYLASMVPKLEAIWKRLGFEPDSHRYVRRIEP